MPASTLQTPPPTPRQEKAERIQQAILRSWRTLSDREIAEALGVSNKTVSEYRKRLESEGRILPRIETTQSAEACLYEVCSLAILPAMLNDDLYDPVSVQEPSFLALVRDIQKNGILDTIVVSGDGYILSGHRRHAAARYLGIDRIRVRVHPGVLYHRDRDEFIRLLASYNRQRVKTTAEQLREEMVLMSDRSCDRLHEYRRNASVVTSTGEVHLRPRRRRSAIRDKWELRDAIIKVINDEQHNLPLSDRAVHYRLLNIPGLVRNDKTRTPYENTAASYNDVTNMLTRMRIDHLIPFESIADETRPVIEWNTHLSTGDFVREQCDKFLTGYFRRLQQSQPNWIELLVEKNTVASQLHATASKYTLPMTSGRGYASLPPRMGMVDRFRKSGREKLVLIVISDFDPEGEDIPCSFGNSLRDDFRIPARRLKIIKAALTGDQVRSMDLHAGQMSKKTSSRHKRFVAINGERVWELEALSSDKLREIVEASIRGVLDLPAFEAEVERERQDQRDLGVIRQKMHRLLTGNAIA